MLDHVIFILTRNYLHDKIKCVSQTQGRAIAQLGRAPRLHVRQCFSEESIMQSNELIDLISKLMSYSITFREKKGEQ